MNKLTICKPKGYKKSVTTFTSNDTYYEKISKYNLSSITIS